MPVPLFCIYITYATLYNVYFCIVYLEDYVVYLYRYLYLFAELRY
jgi:hypothetical protein